MSDNLKVPQVGEFMRNVGKLVKVEDETPVPPPPEKDYIFEDITASCAIYFNGKELKGLGTYNDFYGLGTCVTTAIKEMKEYCEQQHITRTSDLEVRITKVVSQTRMKPVSREAFYNKGYKDFESKNWGSKYRLPEDIETIVWSSKE